MRCPTLRATILPMTSPIPSIPRWLRIAGKHAPAEAVLRSAQPWLTECGVFVTLQDADAPNDYTQIDETLEVRSGLFAAPAPSLGYAGFTPEQRAAFLAWAAQPRAMTSVGAPPTAYRQLYCAALEVTLIESLTAQQQTRVNDLMVHLDELAESRTWQGDPLLTRLLILTARLTRNLAPIQKRTLAPALAGVALGCAAQVDTEIALSVDMALWLGEIWRLSATPPAESLIALRLDAARTAQGAELPACALRELPESALAVKPFHTAHRDLRMHLAQPDLRPTLEPLLADILAPLAEEEIDDEEVDAVGQASPVQADAVHAPRTRKASRTAAPKGKDWTLVLEFSESRSQYAAIVLQLAQKQTNYTTLLDEDRTIVHRIQFRKSELRRFWRLWDYVQGWNSTRVYLNGEELQKWQVWPWSQLFR